MSDVNLPSPPKRARRLSWALGAILAAATFVLGVVVGVVATPDDEPPVAAASPSSAFPSPAESVSIPPAEGVTEPTAPTGITGIAEPTGEVGATLDNPIPLGDSAEIGEWSVEVVGLTKNADAAVERENQFNDKPKTGSQYMMVTLRATFNGQGSSDPYFDLTWAAVSEAGTLYEDVTAVLPEDLSNVGNVPSGVSGSGNILFEVEMQDVNSIVLYLEAATADFETEGAFLALA